MARKVGESLEFNQEDILGKGSSSSFVFRGNFVGSKALESKPTLVAIKRIVISTDIRQEVELMKTAGSHPNILRIIHTEITDDFL